MDFLRKRSDRWDLVSLRVDLRQMNRIIVIQGERGVSFIAGSSCEDTGVNYVPCLESNSITCLAYIRVDYETAIPAFPPFIAESIGPPYFTRMPLYR